MEMEQSELIASLAGPTLIALAVAMVVNREAIREMTEQVTHHYAVVLLSGAVLLVAGLAIVRVHNVWSVGWPVLVTLVGWLAILSGLLRMIFPRQGVALAGHFGQSATRIAVAAAIMLAFGAFLTVKGYRLAG
jgi:uncharacterized membrane protein HdeD (DUF308 family)